LRGVAEKKGKTESSEERRGDVLLLVRGTVRGGKKKEKYNEASRGKTTRGKRRGKKARTIRGRAMHGIPPKRREKAGGPREKGGIFEKGSNCEKKRNSGFCEVNGGRDTPLQMGEYFAI